MLSRGLSKAVSATSTRRVGWGGTAVRQVALFSSEAEGDSNLTSLLKKKRPAPLEFFHEESENERQLLDVITSLHNTYGFRGLPNVKSALTWDDIEKARSEPMKPTRGPRSIQEGKVPFLKGNLEDGTEEEDEDMEEEDVPLYDGLYMEDQEDAQNDPFFVSEIDHSLRNYGLDPFDRSTAENVDYPSMESALNFTSPALATMDSESGTETSEPEAYPAKEKGLCLGGLQRRGVRGILNCSKVDLTTLSHLDIMSLRRFLKADAEILPRKDSELCAKCQRHVAKTIKRARSMGILPHKSNFNIHEVIRDDEHRPQTHASVRVDRSYFNSNVVK